MEGCRWQFDEKYQKQDANRLQRGIDDQCYPSQPARTGYYRRVMLRGGLAENLYYSC